jgi:hypothetical protein
MNLQSPFYADDPVSGQQLARLCRPGALGLGMEVFSILVPP